MSETSRREKAIAVEIIGVATVIGACALAAVVLFGSTADERASQSPHVSTPPVASDVDAAAAAQNNAATAADAAADASLAVSDAGSQQMRRFTKAEFDAYVNGKSKAEIREEFGAPLVVHDEDDSWFYPDLAVYDADAGVQVHGTTIRFSGMNGPRDFVVETSFQ